MKRKHIVSENFSVTVCMIGRMEKLNFLRKVHATASRCCIYQKKIMQKIRQNYTKPTWYLANLSLTSISNFPRSENISLLVSHKLKINLLSTSVGSRHYYRFVSCLYLRRNYLKKVSSSIWFSSPITYHWNEVIHCDELHAEILLATVVDRIFYFNEQITIMIWGQYCRSCN